MTSPSSFNVSGLLSGAAGSIDTTALVTQLVQAAAIPQTQLKNQLSLQQTIESAYQAIASKLTTMQTAAQALTDPTSWKATTATSTSAGVVATSSAAAQTGTTTFNVLALAQAQVTTIAADTNGIVSTDLANIYIRTADNVSHQIVPTSGTAVDVAAAINAADIGVRATVVNSDAGTVLQLNSTTTGAAHSFSVTSGFTATAQTVTAASNAKIGVGTLGAGGYEVSSATNTFTGVIPGVTFSVSALATNVGITITSDQQSISDKVKALVDSINAASKTMGDTMAPNAVLQGNYDTQRLQQALGTVVSTGTATGASFKTYGIDIDKDGVLSFDAKVFAAAYAADPAATRTVLGDTFAKKFDTLATGALDPTSGTITTANAAAKSEETRLTKQIADWTHRLDLLQTTLQAKYTAMQTAMSKLQSQSTYLTSMFKSMQANSNSSSS